MKRKRILLICLVALTAPAIHARVTKHLLGPTGMRGHIKATSIEVTEVEEESPAHGKISPGAVITGVNGAKFDGDARRIYAAAIDEAETEAAGGRLELLLKDKTRVELELQVLGQYGENAPYDCPKSDLIIERAARYLADSIEEALKNGGSFNDKATNTALLGLLATGEREYIKLVGRAIEASPLLDPDENEFRKQIAGEIPMAKVAWYWGYDCLLLGEYYLLTRDRKALKALEVYAVALARGQDAGGLWGHKMAVINGRLPGYAQMNQSSLSCFLGMLMAQKCGIQDQELDAAIEKTSTYFASYIGKGGFNYGVHPPDRKRFNNNGMSGSAALCMAFTENISGMRFFSGLSAASYDTLEQGHASNFFNPLWTPLGAHLSGPEVTQRFFRNSLWFHTTQRSWDGSFQLNGKERGRAGSQTGTALLTYCLPRNALLITGREPKQEIWLQGAQAREVIEMSQIDYASKSNQELLGLFHSPYPQVRLKAIRTLQERSPEFLPQIITMLDDGNRLQKLSALEYLGHKCPPEQSRPQIQKIGAILRNKEEDPEIRAMASDSLANQGPAAYEFYDDILQLILDEKPNDPLQDIDQRLGKVINNLGPNPHQAGLVKNKSLFYKTANKLMQHHRQHARAAGIQMLSGMPIEDLHLVADSLTNIIEDKDRTYHSYHAWHITIGPAIQILADLNIAEGVDYVTDIMERKDGKWGFKVRMLCAALKAYGGNAKEVLSEIREDERLDGIEESRFQSLWNPMVEAIEQDSSPEELISLEEALRQASR